MSRPARRKPPKTVRGSLQIVGVGISGIGQTTLEAVACIQRAERVFYLVNELTTELWLKELNPAAKSLSGHYAPDKNRHETYREITERLVSAVKKGHQVCAVFYGHPGVFVQPSHAAIRCLKTQGYSAQMFPGVSTDGCLYADLGLNPGDHGIQSFEATDFLLARRRIDPTSGLILWQAGVLGDRNARRGGQCPPDRLRRLVSTLRKHYPATHNIIVYRAGTFPNYKSSLRRLPLTRLTSARLLPLATLFIPPLPQRRLDTEVLKWFTA